MELPGNPPSPSLQSCAGHPSESDLSSEFPCASSLPQMQKDFAAQMAACVRHINAEYEVDDLCSSFPERLAELRKAKGERLSH